MSLTCASPSAYANTSRFDLLVSRDAVHQVRFEDLAAHGLTPQAANRISLFNRGVAVPVWIDGATQGRFGPGSSLTFVGHHLRGSHSRFNEHATHNVYSLRFDSKDGVRGTDLASIETPEDRSPPRVSRTLEQDRLRVRFGPNQVEANAELWYWQRLSVLDKAPFEVPVDLGNAAGYPHQAVSLRVNLRGWSYSALPGALADHRVEILLNDAIVASAEWSGQADVTLDTGRISRHVLKPGANRLQFRVPPRRKTEDDSLLVDVALLNWIEIEHVFDGEIEAGQLMIRPVPKGVVQLSNPAPMPLALYSDRGERVRVAKGASSIGADFAGGGDSDLILLAGEPATPDLIRIDVPSDLRKASRQADYLMIAHGSLIEAARPLAEFHRSRGLNVALVDVQDIYDEFNHGVLSPFAIRDFVAYSRQHWRAPSARFVLLVGDASWENHSESLDDENYADWTFQQQDGQIGRFIKNGSTPYADLKRSRNLVPTLQAQTFEGQAASDSELVNIEGDDAFPDLAVGRLPVVDPAEVSAIVQKLMAYETSAPVGPWRRSTLWIANEEAHMQNQTNAIADGAGLRFGMHPVKVYPDGASSDNALYQTQLLDEFDQGRLLVHFFGHGGRYIWRTGPPDPRRNHDLFTLDHLDQLAPNTRLPLILSMTCYSAPFDHPTADSIGEKFLRTEGRGAVGVLAASWRNSPTQEFSDALVQNLLQPGSTVGEAIMQAKRATNNRDLVQTYNYLGDPATRLRFPSSELDASLDGERAAPSVRLDLGKQRSLVGGKVLFDLFGADGKLLATIERPLQDEQVVLEPQDPALAAAVASITVYAWNEARDVDAFARLEVPSPTAGIAASPP